MMFSGCIRGNVENNSSPEPNNCLFEFKFHCNNIGTSQLEVRAESKADAMTPRS